MEGRLLFLCSVAVGVELAQIKKKKEEIEVQLREESLARREIETNREADRRGRIEAERALRAAIQKTPNTAEGYDTSDIKPIGTGYVKSCFKQRYGTPRQGILVPDSRATITLLPRHNGIESLSNLTDFSHAWIIFIFHDNTNSAQELKKNLLKKQLANTNLSNVKSKVKPPRLDGAKVGLFSTRHSSESIDSTPHRPNAIGLSVAKVEGLDSKGTLILSGLDLLEGTPILDIKPYVKEYDSLPDAHTADWIQTPKVESFKGVQWTEKAERQFEKNKGSLSLYQGIPESLRNAINQVLLLDIRTQHERQNKARETPNLTHTFRIDSLLVEFTVRDDYAVVLSIHSADQPINKNE
ncbi:hypothetical protein PROFUN_01483 [Planoprotostelium fungivorum]|uniref:TsaA-like domain-containing protein n=1 Tax=Planoprotostelium fungivorum TaxID=1890364 RepID=A0A2P6NTF0_9EUKA|nr:hypothetical protein PROFUN_01483 [Planoprotostelium fungivorum]